MNAIKSDPRLESILASTVKLVVAHGIEAGHDRARVVRDVAEAFRTAVSAAVSGDGSLDDTDDEMDGMVSSAIEYPPRLMAKCMWLGLAQTGLDLTDLMAQESAWAAVQALTQAQLPPA